LLVRVVTNGNAIFLLIVNVSGVSLPNPKTAHSIGY
jgi:hypothetical protein